jgi:nucleoside-diphosphate-sugar epimerase
MDYHAHWKNRTVLVTGADGFMGSHLCDKLVELGGKVTAIVRGTSISGTTQYALKKINHLKHKLERIIALDIGSPDVAAAVDSVKPHVVFHLAAIAYLPYSFDHPREVHNVNVGGTLNVLDACRPLKGLDRVVVCSSSEVYGTAQAESIDENHPLNPTSPYAASKVAADRYAYSYWQTYELPVSIIRPFNYFGPRHFYDVVPKFITMVIRGEQPTVYGTGLQSRDLTYVTDMAEAFILMGCHPKAIGETVNFGTGKDVTVTYLAEKIIEISGKQLEPVYIEKRQAEVDRLTCDYSKAKRLFGWEPRVTIDEGLELNYRWSEEYYAKHGF